MDFKGFGEHNEFLFVSRLTSSQLNDLYYQVIRFDGFLSPIAYEGWNINNRSHLGLFSPILVVNTQNYYLLLFEFWHILCEACHSNMWTLAHFVWNLTHFVGAYCNLEPHISLKSPQVVDGLLLWLLLLQLPTLSIFLSTIFFKCTWSFH